MIDIFFWLFIAIYLCYAYAEYRAWRRYQDEMNQRHKEWETL